MENETIQIELCRRKKDTDGFTLIETEFVEVEELSESKFRAAENSAFDCRLAFGTEFETIINENSQHEVVKIIKKSEFTTRRFFLNNQFSTEDYHVLGDEIIKQGGFWQVDFGSLATINLPKDATLDLDEIFRIFDFQPCEIVDE